MTDYGHEGPFRRGDTLLEQFEIIRLLGLGGHAYVYECRDQFLDELLAVKVIPNPPNRGRDLLNRARAEAQLLRRLSHPNVVRMHTAAAIGDEMVCLVMEKLEGVTLRHMLALLGRLSVVEALTIVRQVAIGVAAAHEMNVVHRDIKPDNVFVLPPNNHVKVLDFGIAKFMGHGLQTSNKYRFQGTPLYMSPEHLKGAGVTVRSDVYQVGTVLFELIAGVNPNLIDLENPGFEQVAFVQITRVTPALARVVPDAPAHVDWLVQKATAKDADARFATMTEFVDALDRTLGDYLSAHPAEANRMRYADEPMMQAAKELAAREAEHGPDAARRVNSTMPLGVAVAKNSSPPTCAAPEPFEGRTQTEKMGSFRAVPNSLAQDRIPIPRLPATGVAGVVAKPMPVKKPISFAFVMAALGFGTALGLLILWLVLRGNAGAATVPSAFTQGATVAASAQAAAMPALLVTAAMPTTSASGAAPAAPPGVGPSPSRRLVADTAMTTPNPLASALAAPAETPTKAARRRILIGEVADGDGSGK